MQITHSSWSKVSVYVHRNCWHFHRWLWQVWAGSLWTHALHDQFVSAFKIECVCPYALPLWGRIIQCHITPLMANSLAFMKYILQMGLCTVCVIVKDYCGKQCVTAARLTWGAAQAGCFDWTPVCVHALSPSELNPATSWLKHCCLY